MFDLSESDLKTQTNRENGTRTHQHTITRARLCHYACVFACIQFDHVSKYWFVATHQPIHTMRQWVRRCRRGRFDLTHKKLSIQ